MSIVDVLINENYLLAEISEGLGVTLCCIAYAGKNQDEKYLQKAQIYFKKVEKEIENFVSPLAELIEGALVVLDEIDIKKNSKEKIAQISAEAFQNWLNIDPEEITPLLF